MGILARFTQNTQGNVAIIFGVAMVPLVVATGMAVDYARASAERTRIQTAVDSAALAAARSAPNSTDAELSALATAYFLGNFPNAERLGISTITVSRNGETVSANAKGFMPTTLMNVAGIETMPLRAASTVAWNSTKLEVALVLDNTGSMATDGKIEGLRNAAKEFVEILEDASYGPDAVKIGIVPYATQVRVEPAAYKNANWLRYNAGVTPASWTGCIDERNLGYNAGIQLNNSNAAKYPAAACEKTNLRHIERLSSDFVSLRNAIDGMNADGFTNITVGAVWGHNILAHNGPFGDGAPESNTSVHKYLVIMTDGDNTKSRHYNGGNAILPHNAAMDPDTLAACASAKSQGIEIFTIGLMVEPRVDELMRNCATDPGMYYKANDIAQLQAAFQGIAYDLARLRVTN